MLNITDMKFGFAFTLLIITLFSYGQDNRSDQNSLTFATYNCQYLWDGIAPEDGTSEGNPYRNKPVKAKIHMARLAAGIIEMNADVLVLVEVEDQTTLEYFNTNYLQGLSYSTYFIQGTDTETGKDLGLLSRIAPENNEISHSTLEGTVNNLTTSIDKNFIAHFTIDGFKISLIGIQLSTESAHGAASPTRVAEGVALKSIINQEFNAGYEPIVIGDFNDFDSTIADINSSIPTDNLLEDIKSNTDSNKVFENMAHLAQQENRYTHHTDLNGDQEVQKVELESTDFILIPESLHHAFDEQYGHCEFRILNDVLDVHASNHWPLYVRFSK